MSAEKGETISVTACCSEGHFLPPVNIFKGVNKKQEFEDDLPPRSAVILSNKSRRHYIISFYEMA
jgi:hypothetical protein